MFTLTLLKKNILSFLFLCLILLVTNTVEAQTGEAYLKMMHDRHSGNWYETLVFSQQTEFYRNDSLIRQELWQEAVRFPYELRIDFGKLSMENSVIYKKDSTYRFKGGQLQTVTTDNNPFIMFLGGMYFLPFDSVIATLKRRGYDFSKGTLTQWNGHKTFIIGANTNNDTTSNQVWVDAQQLYVVRVIIKSNNSLLDVHLSEHIKLKRGWSETKVLFYRNGQLIQKEIYQKIESDVKLDPNLFNTRFYRRNTWGPVLVDE